MRYSVAWETVAGVEVAVLRDELAEAEARVAPALGNTCLALRIGDWRVLDEPPNEGELLHNASSYGIPILFPWPNRIRGGRFTWEGREYQLPLDDHGRNAIHGLVRNRPWRVVRCEADDDGALVASVIRSTDFPELAEQYPSAFQLTVSYRLASEQLVIDALAENVGATSLPFGYGLHPYFRVPLSSVGRRQTCDLRVNAAEAWELVDLLPTGRRMPATGRLHLRLSRSLGDETYDDVLTTLAHDLELIHDPEAVAGGLVFQVSLAEGPEDPLDHQVVVGADVGFREAVVYAPAYRSIVCLEPYTCTTDAINLQARGIDAGLRVLAPGETWRGRVVIAPSED